MPWSKSTGLKSGIPAMWDGLNGADERVAFKRTADGYVFRAPSRWLIGPARHYLVDGARKDEIVGALADLREQGARALIVAVVAMMAGLVMLIHFRTHLVLAGVSALALLLAFVGLARFHQLAALQPLLAGLPRATERITWRDRLAAASAVTSWTQLAMVGLGFTVLSLSNGFELIGLMTRPEGDDLWLRLAVRGAAVVFFAGTAATSYVIAYVKLTKRPDQVRGAGG
jgi:hypothetical protein